LTINLKKETGIFPLENSSDDEPETPMDTDQQNNYKTKTSNESSDESDEEEGDDDEEEGEEDGKISFNRSMKSILYSSR
jgi:hypothetical protein